MSDATATSDCKQAVVAKAESKPPVALQRMVSPLPCPFCGGAAKLRLDKCSERVNCIVCGAESDVFRSNSGMSALTAWNKRANVWYQNVERRLASHCLTLSNKDSVAALAEMPDGCAQLVVTSPPYDNLRTYGGHSWDFEGTARELYRVLCDGGVLCWNVGDEVVNGSETLTSCKQKIHLAKCGFRVHDTMIYEKLNFSHPERVRYHQVFEYVFVMSKGQPRCFNPLKDKKNATAGCVGNLGVNTFTERDGTKSVRSKKLTAEYGMRGNVWRGKTRGQEDMCERLNHPAMMPKWLARDLILSWSNPGDLVADPFAGSGTTGHEAIANGRRAWLNDVNADYLKLSDESCSTTRGLALAG